MKHLYLFYVYFLCGGGCIWCTLEHMSWVSRVAAVGRQLGRVSSLYREILEIKLWPSAVHHWGTSMGSRQHQRPQIWEMEGGGAAVVLRSFCPPTPEAIAPPFQLRELVVSSSCSSWFEMVYCLMQSENTWVEFCGSKREKENSHPSLGDWRAW